MMKIIPYLLVATTLAVAASGCLRLQENKDVLFQVSTMSAIMESVYDGEITRNLRLSRIYGKNLMFYRR